MNKAKELKPINNVKPIPINKKCPKCKQLKLLSEFTFDMSLKTKDHRTTICNNCMENVKVEEDCNRHTADCIEKKFLLAVATQLDALLALAENGMLIPDEILDLIYNILAQDEKNVKDLDEKG